MYSTMKVTMYNANIFAKRNMHPMLVGVLDKQDHSIIQCSYLMQLPVICSYSYNVS